MLKYRAPFYNKNDIEFVNKIQLNKENNDIYNIINNDFKYVAKNYGIDFYKNYINKIFKYFKYFKYDLNYIIE